MDAGSLAVLNPGGRDPRQEYPDRAGCPGQSGHPPINYHAYAACVGGGFYDRVEKIPTEVRVVLLLLRKKGLDRALTALRRLRGQGRRVWISWKESGLHQVAEALGDAKRMKVFQEICQEADGFLSSTQELVPLYEQAGCRRGRFVPTPYPIADPNWDFSELLEKRDGIFLGTREFGVPSRNHLLAVTLACRLEVPVTVLNCDGGSGARLLRTLSSQLRIVDRTLPYPDYLQLMAKHRVVFQLDRSAVPGQVAGDALLCRMPCVGGDGAVERLAFENICGLGRNAEELATAAGHLLRDDVAWREQVRSSQEAAEKSLGFSAVAEILRHLD